MPAGPGCRREAGDTGSPISAVAKPKSPAARRGHHSLRRSHLVRQASSRSRCLRHCPPVAPPAGRPDGRGRGVGPRRRLLGMPGKQTLTSLGRPKNMTRTLRKCVQRAPAAHCCRCWHRNVVGTGTFFCRASADVVISDSPSFSPPPPPRIAPRSPPLPGGANCGAPCTPRHPQVGSSLSTRPTNWALAPLSSEFHMSSNLPVREGAIGGRPKEPASG